MSIAPYVDATESDVVLVTRDEAHHRDVNHGFASELAGESVGPASHAPYPELAHDLPRPAQRRAA